MKPFGHRNLLIIVLSLWCTALYCQKLKYDVFLFGNKIGETTIELKDSAGTKKYLLKSNTEAKLLFIDKKSIMSTTAFFDKEGKLFSSLFENIKEDGKLLTKALWEQGKLLVDRNGTKSEIPEAVSISSLLLFFTEPKDLSRVFSERLGHFFEISRLSEGTYSAKLEGTTATYTYQNGKLIQLEMSKGALGSVFLKLVQ